MNSSFLFGVATMAYILAMIIYITYLAFRKSQIGLTATIVTVIGFVAQTFAIGARWIEFKNIGQMGWLRAAPFTNLYESLIFFVWCLILGYLLIEFRYKNRSFGAFVTPIAGLALAFIDLSGMSKEIQPLVPALQSNWLLAHVVMSFIAYSTFALAFSTGLMYLIVTTDKRTEGPYIFWTLALGILVVLLAAMGLDYLTFKVAVKGPEGLIKSYLFKASFFSSSPAVSAVSSLAALAFLFICWRYGYLLKKVVGAFSVQADVLDEITYKSIAIGFPIFTLGGLIFGAIWADQAWGVYWSWDPKETWSLISWFVYAFYLHARLLRGWRGKKIAMVAVIGFVAVVFTYLGVNLLLSGLHSYGSE
ncbi:MAG TPA: c-type cytochrome biogenesis protein CcsB [Thermodesulfovibrionales bacterium]|jgi:cytochrome c-type biogenesis protein CcsB|nr:c-type cytochrome biogenesis protein CcsB [Thermodesulfovibrionales bacterium]